METATESCESVGEHSRKRQRSDEIPVRPMETVDVDSTTSDDFPVVSLNTPQTSRQSPVKVTSSTPAQTSLLTTESTSPATAIPPAAESKGNNTKQRQKKLDDFTPNGVIEALRRELAEKDARLESLQQRLVVCEGDVYQRDQRLANAESERERLLNTLERFQGAMETVMLDVAQTSRKDARRAQHQLHFELGHIIPNPVPGQSKELWVEGNRMRELHYQLIDLTARQKYLEAHMESLKKEKKAKSSTTSSIATGSASSTASGSNKGPISTTSPVPPEETSNGFSDSSATHTLDFDELQYSYKLEETAVAASIAQLKRAQQTLESDKKLFVKEIRRIAEEDGSLLATVPKIGSDEKPGRYVLLHLLGKGGFSEVWKAFDLREGQYVACKVHRPDQQATTHQRSQYIRHAMRELQIMQRLSHDRLTKLYDWFSLEEPSGREKDSFVTVLEFSNGMDLDTRLKSRGVMTENDTRVVMMQLASALKYLADQKIIHYDLKPANILFHSSMTQCLDIKVTDFGLSKIMEQHAGTIELTSQGTGTYWYLPPECFDQMRTPQISNKVDIWSAGIIMYQMLFGKRPFGEGASQRQIWNEKLIVSQATKLEFPQNPKASDEAKELIRKCLTVNVAERIDVNQLLRDPFLQRKKAVRQNKQNSMPPPS
jgi:tousled-like kinase